MPEKPENHLSDEDALVNRLIRESRAEPAPGFTRPAQETILAYLMGTATAEQEKLVRKALLESRTFSDEILCMARDIESLDREQLLEQKKSPSGIAAPELAEFLRRHEPDRETRATGSFLSRLQWLLVPRRLVPIAASALAILTFLIVRMATGPVPQIAETAPPATLPSEVSPAPVEKPIATAPAEVEPVTVALANWKLVDQNVDPGYLESTVLRGSESPQHYSDAKEAALAEIRKIVEETKTGYRFRSIEERPQHAGASRTIMLVCQDEAGNHVRDIVTYIASTNETRKAPITLWAFTLPSRALYSVQMSADTASVLLPKEMLKDAFFVFTYSIGGEQRGILGFPKHR